MGEIRILEDHLVNKIAAGEVVERPASVVKELVENALDAGAGRVEVQLQAGGRQLIRVIDDGKGMDRADALMCIERHGTSKIRTEFDLFTVGTLGFRGEAIPSIASVSKFEVITRPEGEEMGVRIALDGGRLRPPEPIGCPKGTQVTARSLFFNVPVRRKFLRTVTTELGHCVEAVTREALIRPDVDWTIEHDGRTLLRCPAVPDRQRRAADLLKAHGAALLPVELRSGDVEVDALLSPVGVHQANAAGAMYLYVNGRYVRDPTLRRAVNEAYRHIVPKGRYPVVVLEVRLPPEEVDVNVHPSKIEVRFRSGRDLFRFVADGLRDALQGHGIRRPVQARAERVVDTPKVRTEALFAAEPAAGRWAPQVGEGLPTARASAGGAFAPLSAEPVTPRPELGTLAPRAPRPEALAAPSAARRVAEVAPDVAAEAASPPLHGAPVPASTPSHGAPEAASTPSRGAPAVASTLSASPARPSLEPRSSPSAAAPGAAPPEAASTSSGRPEPAAPPEPGPGNALLPVPRFQDLRVIGQLVETYILCEGGGELILIDQHAAHERVTLYRLQQQARERLGGAQRLLTPVIVELSAAKAQLLSERLDLLAELNLEVAPYGGSAFAIHAVPPGLAKADLSALVRDVADELAEGAAGLAGRDVAEHVLATMACHNSIRAHQSLSHYEMRELLRALDGVDFEVCAHGRPVAIRIDQAELERRFHRA